MFIRNHFDKKPFEEILNQDTIRSILKYSNTVIDKNWKDYIGEDYFRSIKDDRKYFHGLHKNVINLEFLKLGNQYVVDKFIPELTKIYPNMNIEKSGYNYYPNTGYMSWHTNHDHPCRRVYINYSSESKKSFFRYYNRIDKTFITDYDDEGITIREFLIPNERPYFWHCVGSECDRISFGFRIKLK